MFISDNLLSKAKKKFLQDDTECSVQPVHERKMYGDQGRGFDRSSQPTLGRQDNLNDKPSMSLFEEEDPGRDSDDFVRNYYEFPSTQRERTLSRDSDMIQQSRYQQQTQRFNEKQQADASLLPVPSIISTGHSPVRSRPSQQTQRSKGREQIDASALPVSSVLGRGDTLVRSRPLQHTQRSKERDQTDASALLGSSVLGRGDTLLRSRPLRQTQRSKERDQTDASAIPGSSVMNAGHSPVKSRQTQQSQEIQQVESTDTQGSSSMDRRQPRATRKLAHNKLTSNDVMRTESSTRKTSSSTNTSNVADIEQTILSTRKQAQKSAVSKTLVFECTVSFGEATSYTRFFFPQ